MTTPMVPDAPDAVAARVIPYVLEHFAEAICLEDLAQVAGLSRFSFCRRFHQECGLPPMRWLWSLRTLLAAEFIKIDPCWSLTAVAFACGFTSSAHFSRAFRAHFGESPSACRQRALLAVPHGAGGMRVLGDNRQIVLAATQAAFVARPAGRCGRPASASSRRSSVAMRGVGACTSR